MPNDEEIKQLHFPYSESTGFLDLEFPDGETFMFTFREIAAVSPSLNRCVYGRWNMRVQLGMFKKDFFLRQAQSVATFFEREIKWTLRADPGTEIETGTLRPGGSPTEN